METIRRINRDALRAAQEAEGSYGGSYGLGGNNQLLTYAVAVGVAALAYFLLQQYKPDFVLSTKNGVKQFDMTRAVIASVVAGLLTLLAFHLFNQ